MLYRFKIHTGMSILESGHWAKIKKLMKAKYLSVCITTRIKRKAKSLMQND